MNNQITVGARTNRQGSTCSACSIIATSGHLIQSSALAPQSSVAVTHLHSTYWLLLSPGGYPESRLSAQVIELRPPAHMSEHASERPMT